MTLPDLTFITGGARSGKSSHAERLAAATARPVTYIATAREFDDPEFAARIAHHRARRPAHWRVVEAELDLAGAIADADDGRTCILVDCLTLWLANLLCPADSDPDAPPPVEFAAHSDALETALARIKGPVIVVSNEIGMGVVPLGAMTRRYVDELGRLNQRVAALAREVTLMVAGLPMPVKRGSTS